MMTDSVGQNVKIENDSSRPAGSEPGFSVLERYALKGARTVLRGGGGGNAASLPDRATFVASGSSTAKPRSDGAGWRQR